MTGEATLAYGEHPEQVMDLWVPEGAPPAPGWPVAVLIHGGFWRQRYARDLMEPAAADLQARGLAVVNVEYRRVGGDGGWPTTLTDVAAAVDHLDTVAATQPLDLARSGVAGHSAGGHLALWLAGRDLLPAGAPGAEVVVRPTLTVGLAPVADLTGGAATLGDGAVVDLLGGTPEAVGERYALADPTRLVGHGRRVVIVHGDGDESVPLQQSATYVAAAVGAGDPVERHVVPGDHMSVIDPASPGWERVVAAFEEHLALPS